MFYFDGCVCHKFDHPTAHGIDLSTTDLKTIDVCPGPFDVGLSLCFQAAGVVQQLKSVSCLLVCYAAIGSMGKQEAHHACPESRQSSKGGRGGRCI